jgi:hypothetical protein
MIHFNFTMTGGPQRYKLHNNLCKAEVRPNRKREELHDICGPCNEARKIHRKIGRKKQFYEKYVVMARSRDAVTGVAQHDQEDDQGLPVLSKCCRCSDELHAQECGGLYWS